MKVTTCDYCDGDLGGPVEKYGEPVTCGKTECDREARADVNQERLEAHERLDADRGWL